MAGNQNLGEARKNKNDEFYTRYNDIEAEMNAYFEYNNDVFRNKTILLPCDDPEWSNFTKYFAYNFERFGLKKLISTSYAKSVGSQQLTLFEQDSPLYDESKHATHGKLFPLTQDKDGSGNVDTDDIVINTNEKVTYKDQYERELLTRDPGNNLYKVLDVEVGNAKGYLVAIYHPEKVKLLRTKKFNVGTYGERVVDMCKRYGGVVCINGGGFLNGLDKGSDRPQGYVIENGEVIWASNGESSRADIIGMTKDGKLKLVSNVTGSEAVHSGIYYGIEFGPFLIVNGKSITIKGTPYGVANKCIIAQRKDGIMMFLVTEGETYIDGASLQDVVDTLEKYGAYNAANLDGGQSTSLVVEDEMINTPNYAAKRQGGRYVVTGWGLVP